MKTFSLTEVAKITDRSVSCVFQFAKRNGFSGRRWTQKDIDEYQKHKGIRYEKHAQYITSDEDLPPRLLAIRNKYKSGVPDDEVFALANSIEQEFFANI